VDVDAGADIVVNPDPVLVRVPPRAIRVLFGTGRSLIALVAAAVLTVTGYNWSILHQLNQGIVRTNVFDTKPPATRGAAPVTPPPLTSDVNILLVGMDSRTDPHGNPLPGNELAMLHAGPDDGEIDTDTMILVHIPAGGQQAVAISFPRDSWVQLAGGFGMNRLNSAFAFAHNAEAGQLRAQGMTDPAQIEQQADTAGRKNLIATIENLIGNTVTINRYAEVNLAGFYDMSNAVGGVQVCLNQATHDPETGASFPAGVQTLSGVQALNFVRQRHNLPGGDLDRIRRQQAFLGSLAHKILSTGVLTNPAQLSAITSAIANSITLSSGWDIATFAEQMQSLASGAIQFHTAPTGAPEVIGGADVLATDPGEIQQYVASLTSDSATPSAQMTTDAPITTGATPGGTTTAPGTTNPDTSSSAADDATISSAGVPCVA
jgi:LCP family protein required for cell wall assembly